MRRQINWFVTFFCNLHVTVSSVKIKILPAMLAINIAYFFNMLRAIDDLTRSNEHGPVNLLCDDCVGSRAVYLDHLYRDYRAALMNACSIVLIFQVYLTANAYNRYASDKDAAEKMQKGLKLE
ncbi:MAG: hypothetical protein ACKO96_33115 [Flammeovirgaceae bacterium]